MLLYINGVVERFLMCAIEAKEVVISFPPNITEQEFEQVYGVSSKVFKECIDHFKNEISRLSNSEQLKSEVK